MNYRELVQSLSPEVYANLKRAVELGKWPDGRALTPKQRQNSLEAVIAYEHYRLAPEKRSGYIPPKPHNHCDGQGEVTENESQPLKWR